MGILQSQKLMSWKIFILSGADNDHNFQQRGFSGTFAMDMFLIRCSLLDIHSFQITGSDDVISVRSPVHGGYTCMLASLHYFNKKFTGHFQATFTYSQYE